MSKKNLLSILDLKAAEARRLIKEAIRLKTDHHSGKHSPTLAGKSLGLLFYKHSTRTRVSFEVGMAQLGGTVVNISTAESQLHRGETLEDTARVLSRYLDGIVIRTFEQAELENWARYADIPVINGLSDLFHPCQILSDLVTIMEARGKLRGLKIAYIGDGNNVANSWILAAGLLGLDLTLAVPRGFEPRAEVLDKAREIFPGRGKPPLVLHDPFTAAKDADVLYTDVWTSMGQEKEKKNRKNVFRDFQINMRMMETARPEAIVLHCLPAHRGEEITSEVMDGPNSRILEQAENRLHFQKALLTKLLGRNK